MQVLKNHHHPSFQGKLSIITVRDVDQKAIANIIETTSFQDQKVRRVSDQIAKRLEIPVLIDMKVGDKFVEKSVIEKPKAELLTDPHAKRFIKTIEQIIGLRLDSSPNQRKFMLNKDDSIIFMDECVEKGGVLVKLDLKA